MFVENKDEVITHMRKDAAGNDDGFALVTSGAVNVDAMVLKTLAIDPIIQLLEASPDWDRFWLHSRFATTASVGLATTHGFEADDYYVMHNGILRHDKTKDLDVDSRIIPELLKVGGLECATDFLLKHEDYANVFIISPETGKWRLVRLSTNSLYTDGASNFSTNPLIDLQVPVPHNTVKDFDEDVRTYQSSYFAKRDYGMYTRDYYPKKVNTYYDPIEVEDDDEDSTWGDSWRPTKKSK